MASAVMMDAPQFEFFSLFPRSLNEIVKTRKINGISKHFDIHHYIQAVVPLVALKGFFSFTGGGPRA